MIEAPRDVERPRRQHGVGRHGAEEVRYEVKDAGHGDLGCALTGPADPPRGAEDPTRGATDPPRGAADPPRGAADQPRGVERVTRLKDARDELKTEQDQPEPYELFASRFIYDGATQQHAMLGAA